MEQGYVWVLASVIQFGKLAKCSPKSTLLWQYTMGLNAEPVYIGKGFTLFTKKEDTTTSLFLPQICREEGIDGVSPPASLELSLPASLERSHTGTCQRNLSLRRSSSLNILSSALRRK